MGGGGDSGPSTSQINAQNRADAKAARDELYANRPTVTNPYGTSGWTQGYTQDPSTGNWVTTWQQNTELNDKGQAWADSLQDSSMAQAGYQTQLANQWANNPIAQNTGGIAGANKTKQVTGGNSWRQFGQTAPTTSATGYNQFAVTAPTTGANDYEQFGRTQNTIGADDWREFGVPTQTVGAGDWQQFGQADQTIGAGDWQQFGNTDQTINSGTYDERFGDWQDHGYGDHDMSGGDWNYIDYQPEAIRQRAQDDVYAYETSRLDPQFAQQQAELEIRLRNRGLQEGDQAYDSAMTNFTNNRNQAYEDARNRSLEASRAEAAMLWDQEMGQSEQMNRYHQADIDNEWRARESNIQNTLAGRGQDAQNYLAYQQAAWDQDYQERMRQQNANLDYGREAWQQDFSQRQANTANNLNYSNSAFDQDYKNKMYQSQTNLDYGNAAWSQDFQNRQQNINSDLAYGNQAFQQGFMNRGQQLDADLAYSNQNWNQNFTQQQANVDNNLAYGNQAYNQKYMTNQQQIDQYNMAQQLQIQQMNALNPTAGVDAVGGLVS